MSVAADHQAAPVVSHVVVGVASSAGGVQALIAFAAALPAAFPAAVLVAHHLAEQPRSHLTEVLGRVCSIPVRTASDGDAVVPGVVLVCPAGSHFVVLAGPRLLLLREAPVNFVRPSADWLFESLATTCGRNAVAVILSGSGSDGAAGARAIKLAGGTVIVEDRTTAQFSGMPDAVIRGGAADLVLPVQDIPGALAELIGEIVR
jgi:two-component system chemotaxis response regulator CheB